MPSYRLLEHEWSVDFNSLRIIWSKKSMTGGNLKMKTIIFWEDVYSNHIKDSLPATSITQQNHAHHLIVPLVPLNRKGLKNHPFDAHSMQNLQKNRW